MSQSCITFCFLSFHQYNCNFITNTHTQSIYTNNLCAFKTHSIVTRQEFIIHKNVLFIDAFVSISYWCWWRHWYWVHTDSDTKGKHDTILKKPPVSSTSGSVQTYLWNKTSWRERMVVFATLFCFAQSFGTGVTCVSYVHRRTFKVCFLFTHHLSWLIS